MSKYFKAAIKSLRVPTCEGKGIQVFRIDEATKNNPVAVAFAGKAWRKMKPEQRKIAGSKQDISDYLAHFYYDQDINDADTTGEALEDLATFVQTWKTEGDDSKFLRIHGHKPLNENNEGPKYPEISVQLTGNDGNACAVLGAVSKSLRRAKVDKAEIDQFMDEATAGDYNKLLQTAMKWVTVQ